MEGLLQVQKEKKPLAPHEFMAKAREELMALSSSRTPQQAEILTCPYDKCGRGFKQPVVLTDFSKTPRETYYACPYCFSKLEVALESQGNVNSVAFKTSEDADVMTPRRCSHHLGYLSALQNEDSIPDECLTCPKLIQCNVKK